MTEDAPGRSQAAALLAGAGAQRVEWSPMDGIVTLEIPARADYVVLSRLALAGIVRDGGYSDEAVADLKLALTEACSNTIRHAYRNGGDEVGSVHVSFELLADRVVLTICDHGVGFVDESGAQAEPLPDGSVVASEGGMGIALIQAVVDDFRLEQPDSGGTTLILTKLRDA